ncbi:hypothetical protein [Paraburkholderia sp. GAS42]|uniref:hypothetical protein n=1 Tax=Paraburkholderia sp. GAS42 TaxID=3035135 RepID=UPI003D1EAB5F
MMTRSLTGRYKVGLVLAVLGFVLVVLPCHAEPSLETELPYTQTVISKWSREQRVYVSPVVATEVAAQLLQASVHLCPYSESGCALYRDPVVREEVIRAYLADLMQSRTRILGVMERLFARAGLSFAQIGWPEGPGFNQFVAVTIPQTQHQPSALSYVQWDGFDALPPNALRAILPVGVHTFVERTSDGNLNELQLRVTRNSSGGAATIVNSRSLGSKNPFEAFPSRIEPQVDRFCLAKPVDPSEPKYRAVVGRGMPPIVKPTDFQGAETVRIHLNGNPAGCDSSCKKWIGISVVQALVDWRAGCSRCSSSTLSLVEIENDKYVSVRFVDWMQYLSDSDPPGRPSDLTASAYIKTRLSSVYQLNPYMGFQRIDNANELPGLCTREDVTEATKPFQLSERAKRRLCTASAMACEVANGCKEITIDVGGADDCNGPLACGFPDQRVVLNSREFQFTISRSSPDAAKSTLVLGIPSPKQAGHSIPLFPIVLHEVGHWFGLPHVESDPGTDGRDEVMIDTGGTDDVCISQGALNMVNAAVDESWPFRLTGKGALRYAPH